MSITTQVQALKQSIRNQISDTGSANPCDITALKELLVAVGEDGVREFVNSNPIHLYGSRDTTINGLFNRYKRLFYVDAQRKLRTA